MSKAINPRKSLLRKRAARLAAAQALYSRALNQSPASAGQLIQQVISSWQTSKTHEESDLPFAVQPETALATKLVEAALAEEARIEPAIDQLILPAWKKSRMSLPLLSILRACAAEAIAFPDRPRGMLVEEYTAVAAQLIGDDELAYAHKGFNLLLDALREETPAGDASHG